VPWAERERSQAAVQADIQASWTATPACRPSCSPPTLPGAGGGLPVQFVVRSTGDADEVFGVAEEITSAPRRAGRFIVVQNSLALPSRRRASSSTATAPPPSACRSARSAQR
jgi:multidrug efflux pump